MLKTRQFPRQNLCSDRSDIVALHAKLSRCEAIAVVEDSHLALVR
jgi:hypothetical protein